MSVSWLSPRTSITVSLSGWDALVGQSLTLGVCWPVLSPGSLLDCPQAANNSFLVGIMTISPRHYSTRRSGVLFGIELEVSSVAIIAFSLSPLLWCNVTLLNGEKEGDEEEVGRIMASAIRRCRNIYSALGAG